MYYSRELKPYGLDPLLAVVVPLLALRGLGGSRPAWLALVGVLALTPWVTFGALLPVLAVLAWGWAVRWRGLAAEARRDWAIAMGVFLASAAAVLALAWRGQVAGPGLRLFGTGFLLGGPERTDALSFASTFFTT